MPAVRLTQGQQGGEVSSLLSWLSQLTGSSLQEQQAANLILPLLLGPLGMEMGGARIGGQAAGLAAQVPQRGRMILTRPPVEQATKLDKSIEGLLEFLSAIGAQSGAAGTPGNPLAPLLGQLGQTIFGFGADAFRNR